MWTCSKCEKSKPDSEFGKDKTHKRGLSSWCKECSKEYQRERRNGIKHPRNSTYNLVNRPRAERLNNGKIEYHCCICGKWKSPTEFSKSSRKHGRERDYRCRDCSNALRRKAGAELKKQVIDVYGGKCNCCGISNPAFLTIDHVNNDGKKHRKEIKGNGSLYWWLKRKGFPKDNFQVLCWNCNMGKHHNNGICPHKLS